jgi:UDP-glucose 4-epimerase
MNIFIAGGAGFIGSHCVRRLLAEGVERVTVYDNLTSGRRWHLGEAITDPRFALVEGDIADRHRLTRP